MTPDAGLTAPLIAQWGAYGVILIVLFICLGWVTRELVVSHRERLSDLKEMLAQKYKDSADASQNLRDLKTAIDAIISVVKARV